MKLTNVVETDSGLVASVKRAIAEDMRARNTDQDMVQFMHKSTAVHPGSSHGKCVLETNHRWKMEKVTDITWVRDKASPFAMGEF